jgi:hypothetical protein
MREDWIRIRIDHELFQRYKIVCIKTDLSIPKQTHEIIKNFVDIQESNLEKLEIRDGKN